MRHLFFLMIFMAILISKPSWSRDLICCVSPVNGVYEVLILDPQTFVYTQLTSGDHDKRHPVWSPAGDRVCFESAGSLSIIEIRTEDRSIFKSGEVKAISALDGKAGNPQWISDGKIVYTHFSEVQNDHTSLWQVELDNYRRTKIMDRPYLDHQCDWSPQGLVWVGGEETFGYELFLLRNEDEGPFKLTDNDTNDFNPRWSHDGEKIAWQHYIETDSVIVIKELFSNKIKSFGFKACFNGMPSWSSDNRIIYWISSHTGEFSLYKTPIERFDPVRISPENMRILDPDVMEFAE